MDVASQVKQLVQVMMGTTSSSTPVKQEDIVRTVDSVLMLPHFSPQQKEALDRGALIRELESMFMVSIGEARTLHDHDHKPWLESRREALAWGYWKRYLLLLKEKMPPKAIDGLHRTTDEILDLLEDPTREESWDRRGLVVGHVQSGKTGNYTGLICKAADAGYSVIVVLTGIHSSLRAQTQIRLDEGFLGYESHQIGTATGGRPVVGVGRFDQSLRPSSITSREENGDFKLSVAQQFNITPGGNPLLFVVKKNARVLQNLLKWVISVANTHDASGYQRIRNVPLLVIDDEADNASVDTREQAYDEDGSPDEDHNPTRINALIRELLNRFEKRAYVGYTATPFANIFIHESGHTPQHGEDLFPKSFIMNLPASSDYLGPVKVFGVDEDAEAGLEEADGLPLCRHISDFADDERTGWMPVKHKKSHKPLFKDEAKLPPSLIEAIHSFVLCCAARRARKQVNAHNSMLVHVTRFTDVQREVFEQVKGEVEWIQQRIRRGEGASEKTVIKELERRWNEDFIPTSESMRIRPEEILRWDQVEPHLLDALDAISVRRINGTAPDVLDYERHKDVGISVIAVGGDKLSRGLTLEGLSVSYFLRASKMYDTLMQMGRWFGYRHGYVDLCRLYMTEELEEWFRHVTNASEELRQEFDRMVKVGATPREYGLKVRSHPVLAITAQVKMRHGSELDLSYQGTVSETIAFVGDPGRQSNLDHLTKLVGTLGPASEISPVRSRPALDGGVRSEEWKGAVLWSGVPAATVSGFLRQYRGHASAVRANGALMAEYIDKQADQGELIEWTVVLLSSSDSGAEQYGVGDHAVGIFQRSNQTAGQPGQPYKIRRLLSPRDEAIDIGLEAYSRALKQTLEDWGDDSQRPSDQKAPDRPTGPYLRRERAPQHGLLLIYLIDPKDTNLRSTGHTPFIGLGVSWPGSERAKAVTYRVNNVYYAQEFERDFDEDAA